MTLRRSDGAAPRRSSENSKKPKYGFPVWVWAWVPTFLVVATSPFFGLSGSLAEECAYVWIWEWRIEVG